MPALWFREVPIGQSDRSATAGLAGVLFRSCNNGLIRNSVRGAGEFRRVSAPRSSSFLEYEAGILVHPDQSAAKEIASGQAFARFPAS